MAEPLWNAVSDWKPLRNDPRLRADAMFRALRTIQRADAAVIFTGIDRAADPALMNLDHARATAVDGLLDCIEANCAPDGLAERCLLIFDEEASTAKELFDVVHGHHRTTLMDGRDPVIVERPLIAPSHHTPGIQVADLAVYLRRREHTAPETDPRAQRLRDRLLALIRPAVVCDRAP
ncbi:MAG TPA: DUF3800 domain-containing protein [Baekduia sp.]